MSTRPTLREEQKAATRDRILDAVVELMLGHGGLADPSRLTFAKVAEIAGVSERTVYRQFPTKNALLAALEDRGGLLGDLRPPEDVDDIASFVRDVSSWWSQRAPGIPQPQDPPGLEEHVGWRADRARRDERVVAAIAERMSGAAGPRQRRAYAATMYLLASPRTIAATAGRLGLTLEEAGAAHAWALEILTDAVHQQELEPWTLPHP